MGARMPYASERPRRSLPQLVRPGYRVKWARFASVRAAGAGSANGVAPAIPGLTVRLVNAGVADEVAIRGPGREPPLRQGS